MNVQVLIDRFGRVIWARRPCQVWWTISIKAARIHGTLDALNTHGSACWTDEAYQGASSAGPVL
ncbi:hypothetical protein [Streptomyces sp. NBC_01643]|uniref:hypothetical protein n=1 Tax=Streptomyces sp. NBC_01643 TaxID=2975906 RepID=UPI002F90CF1A|nr:hypothetical protein OHB03_49580 [Streptomyces sp. NBC_01643]